VIEFGGYASLSDMQSAEATLRGYVARDGYTVIEDEWQVLYLQYESPFTIFNRHNEVSFCDAPGKHCAPPTACAGVVSVSHACRVCVGTVAQVWLHVNL